EEGAHSKPGVTVGLEVELDIRHPIAGPLPAGESPRDKPLKALIWIRAKQAHSRNNQHPLRVPDRAPNQAGIGLNVRGVQRYGLAFGWGIQWGVLALAADGAKLAIERKIDGNPIHGEIRRTGQEIVRHRDLLVENFPMTIAEVIRPRGANHI